MAHEGAVGHETWMVDVQHMEGWITTQTCDDATVCCMHSEHATHACTHARTYAHTHARTHARTHACTHVRTHASTHAHTHLGYHLVILSHRREGLHHLLLIDAAVSILVDLVEQSLEVRLLELANVHSKQTVKVIDTPPEVDSVPPLPHLWVVTM